MGRIAGDAKPVPDLGREYFNAMNERDEKQLERLIHRELWKLPELPAPETLVHRVMLAVHVKERRAWWQRPWLSWPRPARQISAALSVVMIGALVYLGALAWQMAGIGSPLDRIWQWVVSLAPLWDSLAGWVNTVALVLQKAGQLYLFIGLGIAASMYLMCVAAGTACYRLAFNRR